MPEQNLTDRWLKSKKPVPSVGQVDWHDTTDGVAAGFGCRVSASGRRVFYVMVRVNGRKVRHTMKPAYPSLKLQDARLAAHEVVTKASKGENPNAGRRRERGAKDDFGSVARLFIGRYARPKNKDWAETARLLGLKPDPNPETERSPTGSDLIATGGGALALWEGRRIASISKADVHELLDGIVDRGRTITANRHLAAIRKLFNWSVGRGLLTSNPAAGIGRPAEEVPRDRVLSDHELRHVWLACDKIGDPFGPLVKLLILTGARRAEVGGMARVELDLEAEDGAIWQLPAARTKNGLAHDVPLAKTAVEVIGKVPALAGCGLVFSTNGKTPVSGFGKAKVSLDAEMLKAMQGEAEEAGEDPEKVTLKPWRLHDLRRTAASGMARLGVDLPVIEKALNHKSGSFAGVVGVYQRHSYADEMRRAFTLWSEHVARVAAGKGGTVLPMVRPAAAAG